MEHGHTDNFVNLFGQRVFALWSLIFSMLLPESVKIPKIAIAMYHLFYWKTITLRNVTVFHRTTTIYENCLR
jgi:hypothetical protein